MLNPFICGTCGFHHHQEEGDEPPSSPVSTPQKSKRSKDRKNPYSTRGRDKFSALLAELEEKKEKIYSQMGSQDISFVWFVYRNSNDCVPIVVRSKEKREEEKKLGETKAKSPRPPVATMQESEILDKFPTTDAGDNRVQLVKTESDIKRDKNPSWNKKLRKWTRPSYYFPAVIVMILSLLVFFGRSAATLCTCLFWYMVYTLKVDHGSNVRRVTKKKKDHVRKWGENKLVSDGFSSPGNNKAGALGDKLQKREGHGKSC